MSLPWVKVHTSLLDNETYKRFSPEAKLTFYTALLLAGKQDLNGRLEAPPFGPLTEKDFAEKTGYGLRVQRQALSQLLTAKFLSRDLLGCYSIERWDEKAGDDSVRAAARDRQRRRRDRLRHDVTRDASHESNGDVTRDNVTDKEEEIDNSASLRSAALCHVTIPTDPAELQALALIFVERFAHTKDPGKARRQLGEYAPVLAKLGGRGLTTEQLWDACEKCLIAGGEVPLFGAKIKRVYAFLDGKTAPSSDYMARLRKAGKA